MSKALSAQNIDLARLEARLLHCKALNLQEVELITEGQSLLTQEQIEELNSLLQRRLRGEPIAYLIEEKEFFGLTFYVTPSVLIPRPDSECIVETALQLKFASILELGVGSGCLLLSILAHSDPSIKALAVDYSKAALAVAKTNYSRLKLLQKVDFLCSDWFANVTGQYDLIIANPPYICSRDISLLEPDVKDFEPLLALDGGDDGLDCYRIIIQSLPRRLSSTGKAIFEIGLGQEVEIKSIAERCGMRVEKEIFDLTHRIRGVVISFLES